MATAERTRSRTAASTSSSRSTASRVGAFSEVSGLTADGDAVDYREGTDIQLERAQAARAAQVRATSR